MIQADRRGNPCDQAVCPAAHLRLFDCQMRRIRDYLKVGQDHREVKRRVAEQVKTATIKNYRIELDE
jgi:hypothetical protein